MGKKTELILAKEQTCVVKPPLGTASGTASSRDELCKSWQTYLSEKTALLEIETKNFVKQFEETTSTMKQLSNNGQSNEAINNGHTLLSDMLTSMNTIRSQLKER